MILHHQIEHPDKPPLFRAAIFLCSPLPFSLSLHHGVDVRQYFGVPTSQPLSPARPLEVPENLIPESYYLQQNGKESNGNKFASASLTDGFKPPGVETGGDEGGPYYNMFHPSVDMQRIAIPTAHIYGQKDSWRFHSLDLIAFCKRPITFQHDGGHEIPRSASEEICDTIEELMARAGF